MWTVTPQKKAIEIATIHPRVFTAVGIHPHDAIQCGSQVLEELKSMALGNDCVKAWGETGLDFNRMFSPQQDQEACFCSPDGHGLRPGPAPDFPRTGFKGAILRKSSNQTAPLPEEGWSIAFPAQKRRCSKYLDLGYHIGITGILTIQKRGEYLRQIAPEIPEDRLLIETDAPYLTPKPQKKQVPPQ